MPTKEPDISGLGHRRLLQLSIHIEIVLFDFLVVYLGKELLDFWGFKTSEVRIEIRRLQIHDKVSQKLFVPSTRNFIEGDIQSLDLVLILDVNHHTLDFGIAQILENGQTLVTADDRHIIIDDNRLHIAKLLDGVLNLLIFLIAGFEFLAGIVSCRTERIHRQSFPFHAHAFSSSVTAGLSYGSLPSSSLQNLSRT